MVNLKEHNAKIEEIERAKKILNDGKPKSHHVCRGQAIDKRNSYLELVKESDGTFTGNVNYRTRNCSCCSTTSIQELREIAVSIIKLTGPLTPEELDTVVIE